MKILRNLFVVAILLVFVFPNVLVVLGQDEPVVVPDGTVVVEVEVIPLWAYGGWVAALALTVFAIGLVIDKAREGNQLAKFGLLFFEASKTMLPLEVWQKQFEENAALTPGLVDDWTSGISRDILDRLNKLETTADSSMQAQSVQANLDDLAAHRIMERLNKLEAVTFPPTPFYTEARPNEG